MDSYENNLQELRNRIRILEDENSRLRRILDSHGISYEDENPTETKIQIKSNVITTAHAELLYKTFKGRKDVYSRRLTKDGHTSYFPVCLNFWKYNLCPKRDDKKIKCLNCPNREWAPLRQSILINHLQGIKSDCSDVVGIYILLPDETCNLLVFDFDHHDHARNSKLKTIEENDIDWKDDVNALRKICRELDIPYLAERSQSGNGVHIWLLFAEPISAELARRFGASLLTRGAEFINQKNFLSYDRMLPAQDHMPEGGLGNLIALPLQGRAVQNGNSVFIDDDWNPYPDQWECLRNVKKISKAFVEEKTKEWSGNSGAFGPLSVANPEDDEKETAQKKTKSQPWNSERFHLYPQDVTGKVQIHYADQIYIDKDNIKPRMLNTLRRMASFRNPMYYRNLGLGYSVKGMSSIITCYRDLEDYLALPRGKWEELMKFLDDAGIPYECTDNRQTGRIISVDFNGELYPEQQKAADAMLQYETGILSAATAFGKTAVGAYLVAQRKVNTLVLVHNREILNNWVEDFKKFLSIHEECPTYTTPKGRQKQRESVIGTLYASHNSVTGIVDVVMVSSLGKPGDISPLVKNYGMVIMDECHHAAAQTIDEVLREVSAKYVYGLTATPKRDDGMEQKVIMQFGNIRHRFTAKEKAALQGIGHTVYPRFTRLVNLGEPWKINDAYKALIHSDTRNQMIVEDVLDCVARGSTPIILTKFKDHAEILRKMLADKVENLFVLHGGRKTKERDLIRTEMHAVPADETIVLIAITNYIGEGFNFPRLDTMMLVAPISWEGNLEQYAGRLHRDYEGKTEVVIYDYVDIHVHVLEKMYHKRLRTYKKIGYEICSTPTPDTVDMNAIYDSETYQQAFLSDILCSKKTVIISSPGLSIRKVKWLIENIKSLQYAGVSVTVLTLSSESYPESAQANNQSLQQMLKSVGVYVHTFQTLYEHFSIIDDSVVWYGNMNLLSSIKPENNMIRIINCDVAQELQSVISTHEQSASATNKQIAPANT